LFVSSSHKHRAGREARYSLCGAAKKHAFQPAMPARADDDEVGIDFPRELADLLVRLTSTQVIILRPKRRKMLLVN
jgi:hypothetical protein